MTRAEIRWQRERVRKAFDWIQRRCDTHLLLMYRADESIGKFLTSRTGRGADDLQSFLVEFNPEETIGTPRVLLRSDALHEIGHMLAWNAWERAFEGRPRREQEAIRASVENAFYQWERAVRPYVLGVSRARLTEMES